MPEAAPATASRKPKLPWSQETRAIVGVGAAVIGAFLTVSLSLNNRITAERNAISAQILAEHAEMRAEHADIRAEMRAEHAEMRGEHADIRAEMQAEHAEMRAEHADIRAEMRAEFAAIKQTVQVEAQQTQELLREVLRLYANRP